MTQSSSVVTKSTENFREGEQKRNLYNADEFIVMNERNYVLLRKGRHPLELEKVYWKNLEDSKLFKPFERADYVPVSSSYKPVTRLKTSDNASKIGIDYNKGADGANTFDGGRQFGIYEEQTPTFRKEEKNQNNIETDHRYLVLTQAAHTILERSCGRPHLDHIFLFFLCSRNEIIGVHLYIQVFHNITHFTALHHSRLILGSTTLYMISLTRFMITIKVASTIVVPIISV